MKSSNTYPQKHTLLFALLAQNTYTPLEWHQSTTCLLHKKRNPTIIGNYQPIALMNNLLKLWTSTTKGASSSYAETSYGLLSDQHDGFRLLRSIHEALTSLIMLMEDAKFTIKVSTSCTPTLKAHSMEPTT
jgi:hypothetical protein